MWAAAPAPSPAGAGRASSDAGTAHRCSNFVTRALAWPSGVRPALPLRARVPRMVRVGRGAVLADRGARGIVGVEPVVAFGAQAAERTQLERGEVATMRRVVIGDGRWRDAIGSFL